MQCQLRHVFAGICGQRRPISVAHPRSLIRAFTVRQQNYWILQNDFAHVLDDVNSHILRMLDSTFSLDTAKLMKKRSSEDPQTAQFVDYVAFSLFANKFVNTLTVFLSFGPFILLSCGYVLTFTTLWINSADYKLVLFFLFFQKKKNKKKTRFDISC